MRLLTATVALSLALVAGTSTRDQSDCPECQLFENRLLSLQNELAQAQARLGELRQLLTQLQASNTAAAQQQLPGIQAQFREAFERTDTLLGMVAVQSALVRQCHLQCRRKKDRPPRQGDPIDETIPRAACRLCEPVLERIKDLQRLRRIERDELKAAEQRLAEHEERGKTETGTQWFGEGIGLVLEKQAAMDQLDELNDLIAAAIEELMACNLRCAGKAPPPKTVTTGNSGTSSGPEKFTMCRPCQETALDLSKAEKELAAAEDQVEQHDISKAAGQLRNEQNRAALRELEAKGQGASLDAEWLRTQIGGFDALKDFGDPDGDGVTRFEEQLQGRVDSARKQVGELKQKLESCEQGCKTKQTSQIFRGPVPYAIAGGAGAVALLASGSSDPAIVANTPNAPQQPPATIIQPVQPVPSQTRRPAGTLSVTSCTCTTNTAAFDGVLHVCEQLRQIRTQGTGTVIMVNGDSPLPTFQGTFSESSGEFSLTATVTIGNTVANAVMAGNVELNGNIHNLRLSFAANGRQTVYELTTTPLPQ